ncbi:hypothetical protein [Spiroplasma endosymbiont of Polydrusus pterygomalis]|uniref:hypothetical protein n=1 Tax=Spiroplasma endosymbiont of Polydrusus pterygomalis TaxID=3139327 RepID=UPI003CCB4281
MKKILTILWSIILIGTSTTSLFACNTQYTEEELTQLKEKNKIDTNDENIKNNLEWIAPQEKPFNKVDNKWYFVVWRGSTKKDWKIIKFKNYKKIDKENTRILNKQNNNELFISVYTGVGYSYIVLFINNNLGSTWKKNNGTYFKSVYRWNLEDNNLPCLIIDDKGTVKVDGE